MRKIISSKAFVLSLLLCVSSSTYAINQTFKISHMGTPSNGYVTVWTDSTFDCEGTNTTVLLLFFGGYLNNDDFSMFTVLIDAAKNGYNIVAVTDYLDAQEMYYNSGSGGRCLIDLDDDSNHSVLMVEYP